VPRGPEGGDNRSALDCFLRKKKVSRLRYRLKK